MAPRGKAKKVQNGHDGGEDVEGGDISDRADWDTELHKIFVRLCVDEQKKGNMPTTHFSSNGWENIVQNFFQETKRSYTRPQLKNHWDCMRKDWYAWTLIKQKATDLDWDPEKRTPIASKEWWEELAKVNKLVLKFKKKGLEHENEYSDLFSRGVTRKRDNSSVPTQVRSSEEPYMPLPQDQTSGYNDISMEENRRDQTEDKNYEEMGSRSPKNTFQVNEFGLRESPVDDTPPPPPSSEGQKRPTDECQNCGCKRTRIPFDGMTSHIQSTPNASSVKETLRILNQVDGVAKGSPLYLLACRLFANPYNRDLFINFEDNDLRVTWLKDMEQREVQVYSPQQFVQFSGGSSQWIAMPTSGFSPLLAQPLPIAVPNQFPSPSNTLSPHSAPDA